MLHDFNSTTWFKKKSMIACLDKKYIFWFIKVWIHKQSCREITTVMPLVSNKCFRRYSSLAKFSLMLEYITQLLPRFLPQFTVCTSQRKFPNDRENLNIWFRRKLRSVWWGHIQIFFPLQTMIHPVKHVWLFLFFFS